MHFLVCASILAASLGTAATASSSTSVVAAAQAESMTLPAGSAVVSDAAAAGGKAVKMTADGSARTSISVPTTATSLSIRVRSSYCAKSWPNVRVAAGATVLMASTKVASSGWTVYSASGISLPAGTYSLSVTLQSTKGPGSGNNCAPVLYVDEVSLYGTPPTTTTTSSPAPTVSLTATPSSVSSGGASTLTWASTDASSCSAGGAWSGTRATSGSVSTGPLSASSTYTLTCSGAGGTATASQTVTVSAPAVIAPTGSSPYTNLVWGDEFDGAAGTQPDAAKWTMKNGRPWNDGLNTYTPRPANVAMDGLGALDLTARRETYTGPDGVTRDYTSGAILTKDKYTFTYGHVEARVWVPAGTGFWSAFWTLRWPIGGEIDIMEILGQSPSTLHATIRNLKLDGTNYWSSGSFNSRASLADGYHVYGMTWEPGRISWQLDGVQVRTVTPADLPSDYKWGFNEPEWITLNLGVGGNWPLPPTDSTPFPSRMKIDWVRVFQ